FRQPVVRTREPPGKQYRNLHHAPATQTHRPGGNKPTSPRRPRSRQREPTRPNLSHAPFAQAAADLRHRPPPSRKGLAPAQPRSTDFPELRLCLYIDHSHIASPPSAAPSSPLIPACPEELK